MFNWNSEQYIKFKQERTQPSIDLINRLNINPISVLDIGCGPGNSTEQLYRRFTTAEILGIDSSEDMLKKAAADYPYIKFKKCIIPDELDKIGSYDLIFSNACLHWIPNHEVLLPRLMNKLNKNGILAVQMPLIQKAPFYRILDEHLQEKHWSMLKNIENFHSLSPNETYNILTKASKEITMWQTTYYHTVQSHNEIIDWYKGSGLRPYLERLSNSEQVYFNCELLEKLKKAFAIQADNKIILKMPRLFFIAEKTA